MKLSKEDGQLFYKLWLPLLDYVNRKYRINRGMKKMGGEKKLDSAAAKQIADRLWDDVSVIDEYLAEYADDMPEDHKNIIHSWKCRVKGTFILERHLKSGSIFISMEDERVYKVCGIVSSWEEMFPCIPVPIVLEAVFIPYRDVLISDGLVIPYNVAIGPSMAKQLKALYMTAKKNGTLITHLD